MYLILESLQHIIHLDGRNEFSSLLVTPSPDYGLDTFQQFQLGTYVTKVKVLVYGKHAEGAALSTNSYSRLRIDSISPVTVGGFGGAIWSAAVLHPVPRPGPRPTRNLVLYIRQPKRQDAHVTARDCANRNTLLFPDNGHANTARIARDRHPRTPHRRQVKLPPRLPPTALSLTAGCATRMGRGMM